MMMYRCWFGEKHPSTGNETWKVEVCQDNEDHCYQVSQAEGTQGRGQGVVQCLYPYLLVDKCSMLMLMTNTQQILLQLVSRDGYETRECWDLR